VLSVFAKNKIITFRAHYRFFYPNQLAETKDERTSLENGGVEPFLCYPIKAKQAQNVKFSRS